MRKIALLAVVAFGAACGSSSSTPEPGNIRLAHLAFGAPGVDFCWAPQGSATYAGPAMKGASDPAGVRYAQASKYFTLDAGTYTVRLVPFAANSCATAVPGVADIQVVVTAGGHHTVAAATLLPTGVQLKAFTDVGTADPAKVVIRFVNAVPRLACRRHRHRRPHRLLPDLLEPHLPGDCDPGGRGRRERLRLGSGVELHRHRAPSRPA